jgi:O-antigen/teichoic acid export membrane protein
MKNIANLMLRGSTWVFLSRLVDSIVGLLFSIIIARMLGVDRYGFIGVTLGVVGLVGIFTHLGLPQATTKYVSAYHAKKDDTQLKGIIYASLILELVLGALLSVVLFLLADDLAVYIFNKPELGLFLKITSPIIFFGAVSNTFMSTFLGHHKMMPFTLINICNFVLRLGLSVFLVIQGYGVTGALMGFVIGWLAGSILSVIYYMVRIRPRLKDAPHPKISVGLDKLIKFGIPMAFSVASILIYEWTDKLVLAAYSDEIRYVSIYSIAFGMVALPLIISRSVNTSFFPIVSALDAKNDRRRLKNAYENILRLTMFLLNPILVGMIVLSPQIIELLYGIEYEAAVYPFLILALWGFFRPAHTFGSSVFAGTGQPKTIAKIDGVTAVLNFCLNILLIPLFISINRGYGPMGAAIATTTSYIIGMCVLVHLANKRIHAKLPFGPIFKSLGAAGITGTVMFMLMYLFKSLGLASGIAGLIVSIGSTFLIGLGLYLFLLFAFKAFNKNDIDMVKSLNIPGKKVLISLIKKLSR